jgi:hypothetical protein
MWGGGVVFALCPAGVRVLPYSIRLCTCSKCVDCNVMTYKTVFLIPNTAAISLIVFLHVHSFLCEEVFPLIMSNSLFTRFFMGIFSPGFISPRRLNHQQMCTKDLF